MSRTRADCLLVVGVCTVVFFTNLGGPRLWDRDEPRNAGCAAEMLQAGDWVTPVFNGQLRSHKPALTYWLMMASYSLLGVNEFSARLASALLGTGTCLLTCFLGRRLFGRSAGLWAAIVLATTMMFAVASRAATPDAPLIFCSTLALALYVRGTTAPTVDDTPSGFLRDMPETWWGCAAIYAAMGLAVLAKGPIGVVLPTGVIGMFLLIRRLPERHENDAHAPALGRWLLAPLRPFAPRRFLAACWSMRPITLLLVVGVVALPWYVGVHLRTDGAWTRGFLLEHHLERLSEPMDHHAGGPLYYPLALLLGFFPWSIFWIPVLWDALAQRRLDVRRFGGATFALCWIGVYMGLFSLARTKLPSYITPCYPAAALLTGSWLARWTGSLTELTPTMRRLAFGSLTAAGLCVLVGLPGLLSVFLPGEEILALLGLVPLLGGLLAWRLASARPLAAARVTSAASIALTTLIFALATDCIDEHRHIEDLVAAVYGDSSRESVELASLSNTEASWVFYCGQPIPQLSSARDASEFLRSPSLGKRRVLITTDRKLQKYRHELSLEDCRQSRVPYFLENDTIIIVEYQPTRQVAAETSESLRLQ